MAQAGVGRKKSRGEVSGERARVVEVATKALYRVVFVPDKNAGRAARRDVETAIHYATCRVTREVADEMQTLLPRHCRILSWEKVDCTSADRAASEAKGLVPIALWEWVSDHVGCVFGVRPRWMLINLDRTRPLFCCRCGHRSTPGLSTS